MATLVRTSKGELAGVAEGDILVFRGIPFAQPPIGDLRFRAPREAEPWKGVRDATRFGSRAVQIPNEALEALLGRPENQPPVDEDCLNLNVWTPGLDDKRRPVMVWIHGGGFLTGSGSEPIYDGTALATRDAVVVTINYRLGPLGFLCVPGFAAAEGETCANFGILDQIAVLKWVQAEIAAFGGNPDNVTIFGESAGAMSVGTILASPLAAGLYHKAILQSGAAHHVMTEEMAATSAAAFAQALGMPDPDAAALRALPLDQLVEAQAKLDAERLRASARRGLGLGLLYQPVIDGRLVSQPAIDEIRSGSANHVPVLIGTTGEEYKLFAIMMPQLREIDADGAAKGLSYLLSGRDIRQAQSILETYRSARADRGEASDIYEILCAAVTDWLFRVPADRLAEAQSARQPVFAYRLDWRSPVGEGVLGACHAIDLPFVFGTHHMARRWVGKGEDVDALAADMGDAWVAFARNGNPSTDALPWPSFETTHRKTMILDRVRRVEEQPREEERRCWDGVIP